MQVRFLPGAQNGVFICFEIEYHVTMSFEQMPTMPNQESLGTRMLAAAKQITSSSLEKIKQFLPEAFDATVGFVLDPSQGKEVASAVRNYAMVNARAFASKE